MDTGESTLDSLERKPLKVDGAYTLVPKCYYDDRGSFQELFNASKHDAYGFPDWQQVNRSVSGKDVIRGIHRSPYSKLVSAVSGVIWDVVVDLRPTSPTYLKWDAAWLMAGGEQMFVPAYCGHGFFSPCDTAVVVYLQSGVFEPLNEVNVHWRDPQFNIEWPKTSCTQVKGDYLYAEYVLSEKDQKASNWPKQETTLDSYLNRIKDKFSSEQLDIIKGTVLDYGIEAIRNDRVRREIVDARQTAFEWNNSNLRD